MKILRYPTILLLMLGLNTYGQAPGWSVNESDFQYTMSFVGFLNVNGTTLSSTQDKVAAFVDGTCRGVANLIYVSNQDRYYAYLTVFSNQDGETMKFKVYDATNDVIAEVAGEQSFQINAHYGNVFQAYSFASPALNDQAEILDFSFSGINAFSTAISGNQIAIHVDSSTELTGLNAVFELSEGAELYRGTQRITSGSNSIDFSEEVQFSVLSEDQQVLTQWEVDISLITGTLQYYKKDAVCYRGGAIRVVLSQGQTQVSLSQSGNPVATQTVDNQGVVFDNLEPGLYTVAVNGFSKDIVIGYKD